MVNIPQNLLLVLARDAAYNRSFRSDSAAINGRAFVQLALRHDFERRSEPAIGRFGVRVPISDQGTSTPKSWFGPAIVDEETGGQDVLHQ